MQNAKIDKLNDAYYVPNLLNAQEAQEMELFVRII